MLSVCLQLAPGQVVYSDTVSAGSGGVSLFQKEQQSLIVPEAHSVLSYSSLGSCPDSSYSFASCILGI